MKQRYLILAAVLFWVSFLFFWVGSSNPSNQPVIDNILPSGYGFKTLFKREEIKDIHKTAGEREYTQCLSCHVNMITDDYQFHKKHLTTPLAKFRCPHCHKSVELGPRTEKGKTRVDRTLCIKCHGKAFPGDSPTSLMKAEFKELDCTSCHVAGQWKFKHRKPMLKYVVNGKKCFTCHGGRNFGYPEEHTTMTWIAKHGPVAKKIGTNGCRPCHTKKELQICDLCHKAPWDAKK